jgi:hypothetical protein
MSALESGKRVTAMANHAANVRKISANCRLNQEKSAAWLDACDIPRFSLSYSDHP